jgi:hypothetical protein
MRRTASITAVALLILLAGCKSGPTLPPATPGGGFIIQTIYSVGLIPAPAGNVTIGAAWVNDLAGATGNPSPFTVITNPEGLGSAAGERAPATWSFTWVAGGPDPACSSAQNNPFEWNVAVNEVVGITCYYVSTASLEEGDVMTFSPVTLFLNKLPASVTGTASGVSSQYGMPVLQYFDLSGTLIAQASASSVTSTSVTVQTPNLSQVPSGTYGGLIQNVESGGALRPIGGGAEFVVAPPGYATYTATAESCTYTKWTVYSNWVYHDASGVTHVFPNVAVSNFNGAPCGTQPPSSVYATSTDGVGMHFSAEPVSAELSNGGTPVPVRPSF